MEKLAFKNYENLLSKEITPFEYLKIANDYLSNALYEKYGREMVIRALAHKQHFEPIQKLLKNLVRKSGLYPYLNKHFEDVSDEHKLLIELNRSSFDKNFVYHAMQAKILNLLQSGQNVVLSAPTSMGKSVIIDSLIASKRYNKIVIVVPTIALIDETRRRIFKNFSDDYQIIFHGSQTITRDKIVFILTQERVNEREDLKNIDLFIIDEFYKLTYQESDDDSRAIALNIALSKLLTISKQFYMIGPHIDSVRGLGNLNKNYVFIPSEFNTVALNINEYNIGGDNYPEKNKVVKGILSEHDGQCLIYCRGQNSAAKLANFLNSNIELPCDIPTDFLNWVAENYGKDWIYHRALARGVGIHHGTLPRAIQQKTIDLFNAHKIRVLLCTSTIIEGVNTVAENVVIYDNRNASKGINKFTHNNIAGRSGRMNQHLVGNVFCLERIPANDFESRTVDVPLGLQGGNTPINLLAGIQNEHFSDEMSEGFSKFVNDFRLPLEILKNNSTYSVHKLLTALDFVEDLDRTEVDNLISQKTVDSSSLSVIVKFIKLVESTPLQRLRIQHEDNNILKHRLSSYIFAKTHQEYLNSRITDIYNTNKDVTDRSSSTENELSILRNIFKYAVPRALNLLQDLVNFVYFSARTDESDGADFGYLMHLFENSHLPSVFTALEEMGIPIQALEKLNADRFNDVRIEVILRYLKMYIDGFNKFTSLEKSFIEKAIR